MGQTQTIFLILTILVILGSIAYFIQSIEDRKRAQKLRIITIKKQIRRAVNIYKGLPDLFMTVELHDFLSRHIIRKWKELHLIEVTNDSQRSFNTFQERVSNRVITLEYPEGSMTVYQEEGQVHHALSLLKETTRWLGDLSKGKQISEHSFNELGWQTTDFYDRVSCDIEIFSAINTQNQSGEKAGFHKFNSALKSLNNLNQSEALDSQIFAIHKHMEILKTIIAKQDEEQELARIEAIEAAERNLDSDT